MIRNQHFPPEVELAINALRNEDVTYLGYEANILASYLGSLPDIDYHIALNSIGTMYYENNINEVSYTYIPSENRIEIKGTLETDRFFAHEVSIKAISNEDLVIISLSAPIYDGRLPVLVGLRDFLKKIYLISSFQDFIIERFRDRRISPHVIKREMGSKILLDIAKIFRSKYRFVIFQANQRDVFGFITSIAFLSYPEDIKKAKEAALVILDSILERLPQS